MISVKINETIINKKYDVLILDVNSLFLLSSPKSMYLFIDKVKFFSKNNNLLVINVIDNGLNRKLVKRYPYYKAHRITSNYSSNIGKNHFNNNRSFKSKIATIHRVDRSYKNHLTFYLSGETDFKIGYVLNYLNNKTDISPDNILTVSFDKDLILSTLLSDVILKRFKMRKRFWCKFERDSHNIETFKKILQLEKFNMQCFSDFYYFLMIHGDKEDNIKQLLTKGKVIKLLNHVIEKYKKISIDNIINEIHLFDNSITKKDIMDNAYLVDIFNSDVFTKQEKINMDFLLSKFLTLNNIKVY